LLKEGFEQKWVVYFSLELIVLKSVISILAQIRKELLNFQINFQQKAIGKPKYLLYYLVIH
jgi:hypothetical protein